MDDLCRNSNFWVGNYLFVINVLIIDFFFRCFLNSYMPVGVELANELTFPSPESTVTGLLMATSQVMAVTFTLIFDNIHLKYGTCYAIIGQIIVLVIGTLTTILTPNNLKRQAAFKKDIKFETIVQEDMSSISKC